jgi:hypothetical protein
MIGGQLRAQIDDAAMCNRSRRTDELTHVRRGKDSGPDMARHADNERQRHANSQLHNPSV